MLVWVNEFVWSSAALLLLERILLGTVATKIKERKAARIISQSPYFSEEKR